MKPDFKYEKECWKKGFKIVIGLDEVGRGCFAGPIVASACAFAESITGIKSTTGTTGRKKARDTRGTRDSCGTLEQLGINDSKLLKPRERERLVKEIKTHCLAYDVTEVGVSVINRIGIGKATERAMRKAVRDINRKLEVGNEKLDKEMGSGKTKKSHLSIQYPASRLSLRTSHKAFVLVDFFHLPYLRGIGKKNQLGIKKGDQKSISIAAASILAKVHRDKLMQRLSKKNKKYGWGRNKGYGTKEHQKAILKYGLTRLHRKDFVRTWKEKRGDATAKTT